MTPDIIIVGQGICGSLLSWCLIQRGVAIQVYDKGTAHSATQAASGIINPITGKRFVKSWMTDQLIPSANTIYSAISEKLSEKIYEPLPIYKLLESVKEQNDWSARTTDSDYERYLSKTELQSLDSSKVKNLFGAFIIDGGGKVDTTLFLKSYRRFLQENNLLTEEAYSHERALTEKTKVIFCDGFRSARQGLFTGLPWQIVKGEYLLVRIKDFYSDRIISGDTTISPTAERDIYYAGATYQWHYETPAPTEQYKNEIIESLGKVLNVPFDVVYHGAGIRPSTKYRRPFIGFHPIHEQVGIFNGMGTKGMSLAPYFAEHFAEHIVNRVALSEEVDVRVSQRSTVNGQRSGE
jgi:glycine/D-amino acid oxidase-like deaminating enzyme